MPLAATSINLNGTEVSIAPLENIDFARLETKNSAEIDKLLNCCKTHGFFYLDLRGTESANQFLADKMDMLRFMETYFDQPLEVKMGDRTSVTHG